MATNKVTVVLVDTSQIVCYISTKYCTGRDYRSLGPTTQQHSLKGLRLCIQQDVQYRLKLLENIGDMQPGECLFFFAHDDQKAKWYIKQEGWVEGRVKGLLRSTRYTALFTRAAENYKEKPKASAEPDERKQRNAARFKFFMGEVWEAYDKAFKQMQARRPGRVFKLRVQHLEADHLMCSFVQQARETGLQASIVLVSNDTDVLEALPSNAGDQDITVMCCDGDKLTPRKLPNDVKDGDSFARAQALYGKASHNILGAVAGFPLLEAECRSKGLHNSPADLDELLKAYPEAYDQFLINLVLFSKTQHGPHSVFPPDIVKARDTAVSFALQQALNPP